MPLDIALNQALTRMKSISPYVMASKSGCDFAQGRFILPFFQRTFHIYYPELRVVEADSNKEPSPILRLVLFHYLLTADGTSVADSWVAYRHLPGSHLFAERFENLATRPLVEALGNNLEGFRQAAEALAGIPMSRSGDAAYRFLALPRIPMACILYLGDEEVSSSVSILFDAAAPHYLPTEDLSFLGVYLGENLKKLSRAV